MRSKDLSSSEAQPLSRTRFGHGSRTDPLKATDQLQFADPFSEFSGPNAFRSEVASTVAAFQLATLRIRVNVNTRTSNRMKFGMSVLGALVVTFQSIFMLHGNLLDGTPRLPFECREKAGVKWLDNERGHERSELTT